MKKFFEEPSVSFISLEKENVMYEADDPWAYLGSIDVYDMDDPWAEDG